MAGRNERTYCGAAAIWVATNRRRRCSPDVHQRHAALLSRPRSLGISGDNFWFADDSPLEEEGLEPSAAVSRVQT
jgi:hypothetical protein